MISFQMSEEQQDVRDMMRAFAAEQIRPLGRECDESSSIPNDLLDSVWELGLTTTQIPEEFGGGGEARSRITNSIILEELGHGDAAIAIAALAPSLFANAILDLGSEAQKKQYLPLFCTSSYAVGSLAIAEHSPAADPFRPRTVAEPKGDGFVLSGAKSGVVMGDRASHFIVVARNGDRADAFIVARDAEGLTISEPELNMGLKGLTTVSLELERVEVGAGDRLGGDAGADIAALINNSRIALASVMIGVSRAVLEYCIPYAKDRVAFDEAIAKKQSIAFRLAEMHIEIEAMRNLTWQAASLMDHGEDVTKQTRWARTYAAEKGLWITDNGIQVLGGHGFIREHPVEMWFRAARTLGVLEGTVAL